MFALVKKYLGLIREGNSLKDKIAIAIYAFNFLWNRLSNHKCYTLICDVTLKNRDGIFFCGNNIFSVFIGSSFHELKIRRYFDLNKGVFVDIGANIGKYTIIMGKKLKDKGKVIAIEPEKKNFEILKKNVELNGLDNVILINAACFSKEKKLKFYLDKRAGSHSFYQEKVKSSKAITVQAKRLDKILSELKIKKVDLIKMDVEGAEAEVLKGATRILKSHPKIIFEAWDENYLKKVKKVLKPFNYKIKKIDEHNYLAY